MSVHGVGPGPATVGRGGRARHGWTLFIAQGLWLALMLAVGVALIRENELGPAAISVVMWGAGAGVISAIRWAYLRLRPWREVDWRAISDAIEAHPLAVAVAIATGTIVPLLVGAAFDVYALLYWGVLSAYTGVAWAVPGVLVWLGVDRRLRDRGVAHRRRYTVTAGIAAGLALLVTASAIIGAFEPPS